MTFPTSIVNNGDTTYTIAWNNPVTVTSVSGDANMLLFSPSAGWFAWTDVHQIDPHTILVTNSDGDDDCTLFVMLAQPAHLTSAQTFNAATPLYSIP